MGLSDKRISNFLLATQGVGVIFIGVFLTAYLGGLPSTNVLHSEPVFRTTLAIFGLVLLALIAINIVLAIRTKSSD